MGGGTSSAEETIDAKPGGQGRLGEFKGQKRSLSLSYNGEVLKETTVSPYICTELQRTQRV